MNNLALKFDSGSFIEDEIETYPQKRKFDIIGEITDERIDSFFREKTIDTEEKYEEKSELNKVHSTNPFAKKDTDPIASIPDYKPIFHTFKSLFQWEGYVVSIEENSFTARIVDLSGQTQDEEIEIEIDDISIDDRELIEEGALFNMHIGKENRNGTIRKSSIIAFRRMPRWTRRDFNKAENKMTELVKYFGLK